MVPRIALALSRPTFQRQLKLALDKSSEGMVDVLKGKQQLWQRLEREICDLVVLSYSRIPQPAAESICQLGELPDAPALVVILEVDDAEQQARLLAAGCQAVLDDGVSGGALVEVVHALLQQRRDRNAQQLATGERYTKPQLRDFVSHSPVMQAFMEVVNRIVSSRVSVLILGETGVGKERLGRAIHNDSPRSAGPFVAVNCGALPEALLESELFGHEEGAFTGATRSRRGCFEMAHGGTVFLDEIGELPLHLQVKLLRVLQDRDIRRLGGERSVTVDVRIMAATNRDLEQAMAGGLFRRDLYYRLSVMTLTLPPLRQRQEDIRELVLNYIHYLGMRIGCEVESIDPDALEAMCTYPWPGNVRELINVVERAMLLAPARKITLAELPQAISHSSPAACLRVGDTAGTRILASLPEAWLARPWREVKRQTLEQVERAYLTGLLQRCEGRVGLTAQQAGMEPRSLYEKMRSYGLRKEDFRGRAR